MQEDKFKLDLEEKERDLARKEEEKRQEIQRKREETLKRINQRQEQRALSLQQMKEETKRITRAAYGISTTKNSNDDEKVVRFSMDDLKGELQR